MKISIILPYKENFSSSYAGAVSLLLKDVVPKSKFKNVIKIYGSTNYKKDILKKNYINLNSNKLFFQSSTNIYLNNFLLHEKKRISDLIEIHNRPNYINKVYNINKNIVLYFHNDPLEIKGSKSVNERINLLNKTKKIIFISKWVKKQFLIGVNKKYFKSNNFEIIPHCINKTKINYKNKKNLIIFVGRLNRSKGYDVFGNSIIKILNKYNNWKSVVLGDEPREKLNFKHKNLKVLGFKSHSYILKLYKNASISVVCSRWNEPFGRTALEASSRGCAVIITNRGGLPEAANTSLKINNLNVKNIYKAIEKLIKNKKFRVNLQKNSIKNFYLTNDYVSNKIDKYRNNLIKV